MIVHRSKYSFVFTLVFMVAVFFAASAAAQPDLSQPGFYSIKTVEGYLMIRNGTKMSLRFDVVGKNVKPIEKTDNPSFLIDGKVLQILTVPRENFEPTGKNPPSDLLGIHQKWESDYLANEVFGGKLELESKTEKIDDRSVLLWSFKRPRFTSTFDRDLYATTLFGDDIFGMNCPVKVGEDTTEYRKLFDGVFRSLKMQDKPFDVEKIASEIRNGVPAE